MLLTSFTTAKKVDLSHYAIGDLELCYTVPTEAEVLAAAAPVEPKYQLYLGKSYVGFKEALGFKESRGNYSTINAFGYLIK